MLSAIFVTFLFELRIYGAKADLDVTFDDAFFVTLDPEYYDLNQTSILIEPNDEGVNVLLMQTAIIKMYDESTIIHFALKELTMGRYIKSTGIDVKGKICEVSKEPIIVGPFLSSVGFNDKPCPPPPAVYVSTGYTPSNDVFPETFGENKYLLTFELTMEGNRTILAAKIFLDITEDK